MTTAGLGTFDEFLKSTGIEILPYLHDPDRVFFIDTFRAIAEDLMNRAAREGRPFEFDMHFIDGVGLNAFAATFSDIDIIALHSDILPILTGTARGLMSNPQLFPDIKTEGCDVSLRAANADSKDIALGILSLDVGKLDDVRRDRFAMQIAEMAMKFIIYHEIAHIINGHTRWLREQGKLALIAEVQSDNYPSIMGMERETLEWDADSIAIGNVLVHALLPETTVVEGRDSWKIPSQNFIGSNDDAIDCVTAAIFICAKYFACMDNGDICDPAPRSHPHPIIRLYSGVMTIEHVIAFRTGGNYMRYYDQLIDTVQACNSAWNSMFDEHVTIDWTDISAVVGDRVERYELTWAELHPHLSILSRGTRLAPATAQPHPAFPTGPVIG